MIIYEVTVKVRADLVGQFEKYMREKHISEVLATGFFYGARFLRVDENLYRTEYEAHSQTALDKYLETYAADLRKDFLKNFPQDVEASRKILEVLESWKT